MLVRPSRALALSGGLRCKTQLFSCTLYMAASSKTPPHQSKDPQKFKTPLQVPVFPGSSLVCRHTSCKKPSDSTSFHSVLVCHRTSSQEVGGGKGESKEVKIARERRVLESRTHKRVSPWQKITRTPRDCETRTHLKKRYLEGFSDQGVTQVRRITLKRDSTIVPTKHLILTFNSPKLPNTIKAGYLNCKIRPYIPNPLRCFKCQRFGHSQTSCRGQLTCSRCASVGHSSTDCTLEPKCVNCTESHPSDSKLRFRPPTYHFLRGDWDKFTRLAIITGTMVQNRAVDEAVFNVTEAIRNAADAAIPKTSNSPRKLCKPWWNASCQQAKKEQRRAWGIFRRYPTTDNLIAFKRAKALARRIRRQCQRESWIQYVSSITSSTTSQQLWRKVKAANGLYRDFNITILETSTALYSSPLDVANLIGKTFASVSSSDSYSPAFQATKNRLERTPINFRCRQPLPYNCDFDMFELKRALSSAHNTSPGPDGISYVLLRHLSADSLVSLLYLFNRIWREQVYPTQWQEAIVIPILKPGKDPKNPLSYRPIALTSCLCKTLERMANARLVYQLEKNKSIPLFQSGFRKGRSTLDNIITLENKIRNAFVRRNHLVSIFFDIEKAYDRTWRYGILRTLFNFGFRGNLPTFIKKFLNLRTFRVRLGGTLSAPFTQAEGVPQGSILSVTLFICHISSILNILSPSIQASLYVDDLQISCEGSDMRMIERQLQTAVNNILKWCDTNGHSISASKSCCVHFCRKRGIHPDPEIRIRDIQIPVVPDVRFLGVIFDRRLTFLPHILHLRKRCEKSLNLLKVLSNTSWGADRTSLLRVYQAIVLSRIDYGCVAYGSACNSTLKKLDPVHHMALRICSGAFRTSPVQSLYVNCHQFPLDLRRRKLSIAFYFKILSVPSHPLQNVYMSTSMKRLYDARPSNIRPFMDRMKLHISELDLPNVRIQQRNFFLFQPWNTPRFHYINPFATYSKSTVAPVVFQRVFEYHRSQYSRYSAIYTDGSKRADYVGCGVVIEDIMHGYRLDTSCSVFTAEAVAIYRALQLIDSTMPRKYCIYTDSLSVLEALENYNDRCHPVLPSHVGIIGNEQADSAAKSATTHLPLAVPLSDMKRVIMHHIFNIWQESWSQQLDNKLHSVKPVIGAWPVMPMRRTDVKLTRLRIGHTRFTHRHLLFGERAPECPSCHVSYTVRHILIDCPVFNHHRITFFHTSILTLSDLKLKPVLVHTPPAKLNSVSTENLPESVPNESNSEHSTAAEAQQIVKRKSRNRRKRSKIQKPDIEIKRVPHRSRNATPTETTTDDEDMITYDVKEEELEQDPFILPEGYLRALTPSRYRNYRE
ncbi:probable RNA-directed DNA polymerase from transposon X-element [Trichonephila clavipes]|nr:probable RNA-directed DNA polymerase from transposon X-element [Trichonephila clavipes]